MSEILKFLAIVLLPVAGWALRRWAPRIGLLVNQWLPLGLLGLWLAEGIAGIFAGPEAPHRVLAHAAVLAAWLAAPLGVGIFLYGALTEGTARSWAGLAVTGLSMIAVLLTAVTGYTGPTRASTGAEHVLRFEILHLFAAPVLTGGLFLGWAVLARRDLRDAR